MIENTHQESNIYNKFTFSWLNPFIWKGWKGGAITREDLLHAKVEHRSSQTASRFSQKWKVHRDAQTEEERASQSAGALYKTIYEFLPGSLVSSAFLELLRVFTYQAPPALLSVLVSLMLRHSRGEFIEHYYLAGGALCAGLFLCLFLNCLFANQAQWILNKAGLQVRTGLMAAIYTKSLQLSGASRQQFPVGKAVQLMSADVLRIDTAWDYLHFTWAGPLQLALTFLMLYRLLGWSALAGCAVLLIFIPIHAVIVFVLSRQRDSVSRTTERRIRLLQEIILGVKIIKYYAWEDVFARRMSELRHEELRGIRNMRAVSCPLLHPHLFHSRLCQYRQFPLLCLFWRGIDGCSRLSLPSPISTCSSIHLSLFPSWPAIALMQRQP